MAHATIAHEKLPEGIVPPAARTWTDPMPRGFDEQVAFFKEQGFLILGSVLSRDELTELDRELVRLARDHQTLPSIREGFDLEPDQDASRPVPTFR